LSSSPVEPIELSPQFAGSTATDRRRSDRTRQNLPGWVSADANDRQNRGGSVNIVDLSLHGIGFHDESRRYKVGATHWVVVSGEALRLSTRVRVVSCRPSSEGGFDIGASFF